MPSPRAALDIERTSKIVSTELPDKIELRPDAFLEDARWHGMVNDIMKRMSYKPARTKAVTVRVPAARLIRLMRARRLTTQSELINVLLEEEEERQRSAAVLRETAGTARASDFDDRLL
jgi:hypothetical protein